MRCFELNFDSKMALLICHMSETTATECLMKHGAMIKREQRVMMKGVDLTDIAKSRGLFRRSMIFCRLARYARANSFTDGEALGLLPVPSPTCARSVYRCSRTTPIISP